MSWLVPRPASLKLTVSDPSLLRLPLALTKCSFWASACWAMRAKATKTNATTAILLFICCTSPHKDAAPVVGGAWPRARSAMGGRRCPRMWHYRAWRPRVVWRGAGALSGPLHGHSLVRTRMTSMSAGRLGHAGFSRRHGVASILLCKEVGKLLVSNVVLYRQASVHTSRLGIGGVVICLLER